MPTLLRRLLGRPSDWHLRRPPAVRVPRPRLSWLGPIAIVASLVLSWPAFQGAQGEEGGSVALGLYVGAASILLMAWSFILAVRFRFLERFFGGLDSMYRVHRWAGALAVPLMFWHVQVEPEIEGGIRGASEAVAESAEELAGTGELMLYGLILLSLLRWFPYRWWRWSHKLLGIPFAFASWHFFTAEKTYANGSPWGWWFGGMMVAGLVTWLWRVLGRDVAGQGLRYRITSSLPEGSATQLEMEPVGTSLDYRAGQFAFLRVQLPGMKEPHPFTIASAPGTGRLRFVVRDLGDWSGRLIEHDREHGLAGVEVLVEGPYGTFEPFGHDGQPVVWIAGGVGITPFLAAIDELDATSDVVPHLLYAVRDADENGIVDRLRLVADRGLIRLSVFESSIGNRLGPDDLSRVPVAELQGAHVALCGPAAMVSDMSEAAMAAGAAEIETEDFDMRQGFGPDLSRDIDDWVRSRTGADGDDRELSRVG